MHSLHYEINDTENYTENVCDTEKTRKPHWKILQRKSQWLSRIISLKYSPLLFKDTEITLKKNLNHTEKFQRYSSLFSVTLDFQCDFQCHNIIVLVYIGFPS